MWSPDGLGADDRAGIYAILTLVKRGYRPHIIFTTDEERGCIGASKLVEVIKKCPFKELKYIIELDRRGANDSVFYDCDNKKFEKYVNAFGFKTDYGSYSDISVIAPAWGVAAVNLSVGYLDEHSELERLYCSALENTISKVEEMLKLSKTAKKFKYIPLKREKRITFPMDSFKCAWCDTPVPIDNYEKNMGLCDFCYGYFSKN